MFRKLFILILAICTIIGTFAQTAIAEGPNSTPVGIATGGSSSAAFDVLHYWVAESDGTVIAKGLPFYGDPQTVNVTVKAPIVEIVATPDHKGYWLLGQDGGVFAFGDAGYFGSMANSHLYGIVAMVPTPDGHGYFLLSEEGAVASFGDAPYLPNKYQGINYHAVSIMNLVETEGYAVVYNNGAIADITMSSSRWIAPQVKDLAAPILGGCLNLESPGGYWLFSRDGGVFALSGAPFYGSLSGNPNRIVVSMSCDANGGYWLLAGFGRTQYFGPPK